MRAERLLRAEMPAIARLVPATQAAPQVMLQAGLGAVQATHAPTNVSTATRRRRLFHRGAIRVAARAIDALATVLVTVLLCIAAGIDPSKATVVQALPYLLLPVAGVAGVWMAGGYRFRYAGSVAAHLCRIAIGGSVAMSAVYLLALVVDAVDAATFAQLAIANALTLFGLHANYLSITRVLTRAGQLSDNVVIVGATEAARRIVARNTRERELNILGYFDDRAGRTPQSMEGAPFLGGLNDLLAWPRLPEVDRIVVTVTSTAQTRVNGLIDRLRGLPQEIILVLDLDGFNPEQTSLARVADAPAAYISGAPKDLRRAIVKRLFDLTIAGLCLIAFFVPMTLVALLVKLDSPGPVFFRQKRHGFNNEIIRVWKFRSMRPDRAAEDGMISQTQHNDPRVTRLGRILRATSIDELPQLLNVISGEMSLVGPRPHAIGMTTEEVEVHRIVGDYAHRHRMKPGLTGWAQINGSRGPVHTTDEVRTRVALDMEYVAKASVWLDLYILVMTVPRLLGDYSKDR
jgi:Undecaprenyl-phosphate glucose phosphotransferase